MQASNNDKKYAPISRRHDAPCGGRKGKSKRLSHKLLRSHLKRELKTLTRNELKEIMLEEKIQDPVLEHLHLNFVRDCMEKEHKKNG